MVNEDAFFELIPGELGLSTDFSVRLVRGLLKQQQVARSEVSTYEEALAHPAVRQVQQTVMEQLLRLFRLTSSLLLSGDRLLLEGNLGFYAMLTIGQRTVLTSTEGSYSTIIYNLDCLSRPEDPPLAVSRWKTVKL